MDGGFFFSLSSVKERTSTTANNIAEVWAVRNVLQMSWELGYKHEVLESDSTFVISYLKSHGGPTLSGLALEYFFFFFLSKWMRKCMYFMCSRINWYLTCNIID